MFTIRKAHPRDAMVLADFAELTFRITFGDMNTPEHMDLHCRNSYGEQIQSAEISNPGIVTLLSENEGKLVGYAQLRWGEAPGCVSAQRPSEIHRLYVADYWHGKGVGPMLMKACIDEIKHHGSDAVWLGVWEHNPKAIAFYKKFGFLEVGDHSFSVGGDPQRDIVMVKSGCF